MAQTEEWASPESLQPSAGELQFDLARALDAMVLLRALIPADGSSHR